MEAIMYLTILFSSANIEDMSRYNRFLKAYVNRSVQNPDRIYIVQSYIR